MAINMKLKCLNCEGGHHDPCIAFGTTVLRQDNFTQQKHEASSIQEPLTGGSRKRTISQSTECGKNAIWPVVFIYGGLHPAREAEGRWKKRSKSAAQQNYRQVEREREKEKAADLLRQSLTNGMRFDAGTLVDFQLNAVIFWWLTCLVRKPPMGKMDVG